MLFVGIFLLFRDFAKIYFIRSVERVRNLVFFGTIVSTGLSLSCSLILNFW